MKNTFLILIFLFPVIALSQDKNDSKDNVRFRMVITNHTFSKVSNESERNIETVLIDDRNFSKPLIEFNLSKSYSLGFTEKDPRLFKLIENKDLDQTTLQPEPLLDFKWQLKKSN